MLMTTEALVEKVAEVANSAFGGSHLTDLLRGTFRTATSAVKSVFCELGHDLGYLVCAAGCLHADDGEWLYDLCWYEVEQGIYRRQPLVLELEWKPGGAVLSAATVDGDFQKLVQARSDVRVWFCAIPNNDIAKLHIANCKHQIGEFSGSISGDRYIFIIYDWTSNLTTVELYQYSATKLSE